MNFYDCSKKLKELYNKIGSKDYLENETYETIEVELNEVFINTIKTSINENIYFSASPLDLFIIELEKRMEINQKSEIDFDDIEYIKEVYLFTIKILTAERYWKQDNDYFYLPQLNNKNIILLRSILKKRTEYLEKLLYKKGIEIVVKYPNGDYSIVKRTFKKNIKTMVENDNLQSIKTNQDNSTNKHEHIFSNNGFILFEYILNKFVSQNRGRKTDIAFYYWSMYNDKRKYIHQRPEQFKKWFFDTYDNEDLGQLKTYENAKNKNRLIMYSTALEWFNTK